MTNSYDTDTGKVANAIAAVYENKRTNKKDNISGDYSSDTESYPTVKAVKGALADKVNVSDIKDNLTSSDTDKPLSAKQGKALNDNKAASNHVHGNITNDGKVGTVSGKPLITGTGGAVGAGAFGTSAGQFAEGDHTHSNYEINVVKQSSADTGYAATYYVTQNGTQVGAKIQIMKDKMLKSISIETVGSTPTQEETDAGLHTGDKYILMVVNTADSSDPTRLILPITDIFDLQTADNVTLTLTNGVYSIKTAGVDTAQIKDGAVTADKIASAVKSSWLTTSDVQSEISAFCDELAEAINPSS